MKIDIVIKDDTKLENPLVVCGLPGSALVGKVAVDHLIESLDSKLLADIYCEGLPPQIFIEDDGSPALMKNEIYYSKKDGNLKRDLLLYTGDAQPTIPEAEYALAESVINMLQERGSKELITLGAYSTGEFSKTPKVYAALSEESLASRVIEAGCDLMKDGVITGMNGLMLGMAKIKGMLGYALLGETSGYAIDPGASEALLVAFGKLTGVKVDMKELEARAKEAQSILGAVEASRRTEGREGEEKKPGYIT